jgi:hypothetical protein
MPTRINHRLALVLLLALAALLAGCSGGKTVTRMETDTTVDLSGNWNDTDSRLTAETLISQSLGSGWYGEHRYQAGKNPVVIVGPIRNKSAEHIPVKTFVADLERAMINSGKMTMVASSEEREALRGERADQQSNSSVETMKEWGQEMGADFMLLGEINTIIDREQGDEVKFYQVDVYLVNLETSVKAWAGYQKIKKYVSRDGYRP